MTEETWERKPDTCDRCGKETGLVVEESHTFICLTCYNRVLEARQNDQMWDDLTDKMS